MYKTTKPTLCSLCFAPRASGMCAIDGCWCRRKGMKSAVGGDFRFMWVCRYLVGMWAVLSSRSVTNRGKQGASDCRYAAQQLAAAAMLCVSRVAPERCLVSMCQYGSTYRGLGQRLLLVLKVRGVLRVKRPAMRRIPSGTILILYNALFKITLSST